MILKQILFLTALFPCFRKKAGPICPQTGPCLKQNRPKTTFRQQPYAAKQAQSRRKYYHNSDDSKILKITTESRPAHPKPPVRLLRRARQASGRATPAASFPSMSAFRRQGQSLPSLVYDFTISPTYTSCRSRSG